MLLTKLEHFICHGNMKASLLKAIALIQSELFPFTFPNIPPHSHREYKELILLYFM